METASTQKQSTGWKVRICAARNAFLVSVLQTHWIISYSGSVSWGFSRVKRLNIRVQWGKKMNQSTLWLTRYPKFQNTSGRLAEASLAYSVFILAAEPTNQENSNGLKSEIENFSRVLCWSVRFRAPMRSLWQRLATCAVMGGVAVLCQQLNSTAFTPTISSEAANRLI